MACAIGWLTGCQSVDTDRVVVLADFEGEDWAPWTPSGTAFLDEEGNARKARAGGWEGRLGNVLGTGLVDTFVSDPTTNLTLGDGATGALVSPDFVVERRWLNFGIDGGAPSPLAPESTTLSIYVDDALWHFATGDAAFPLALQAMSVDLDGFLDRSLRIEITDASAGGFGWIAVDGITLSDTPAERADVVLATFDDATDSGWAGEGDFADPAGSTAWAGVTEAGPSIGPRGVSSCELGGVDCASPIGRLTSPTVDVASRYLNFLVAGGLGADDVAIEVVDETDAVLASYAPSDCATVLTEESWRHLDLDELADQTVRVRIVDESAAVCGHLLVDHVYLSDQPRGLPAAPELRDPADQINVEVAEDGFDDVIGTFDDPVTTLTAEGWTALGDFANPPGPLAWRGTTEDPLAARVGAGAVSTCELAGLPCDAATGELRSPPFVVRADFVTFLMAGGDGASVGLQILDDQDGVLADYRPSACAPSFVDGNDDWHHIDVSAFRGQTVTVRLFDESSGNCGFVSFDHVYQSDAGNGDLVDVAEEPMVAPPVTNVTVTDDAFDQVIVDFDDPQALVLAQFQAAGAFEAPGSPTAWEGTTRAPQAARVGTAAVSTCEIAGPGTACDEPTGSLTTPRFNASANYVVFLMAGGDGATDVGIEVLDTLGEPLATYRPNSCNPSYIDSDDDWVSIDISSVQSEDLQLRLFDDATGSCGFVSMDHAYLSDTPRGAIVATVE